MKTNQHTGIRSGIGAGVMVFMGNHSLLNRITRNRNSVFRFN